MDARPPLIDATLDRMLAESAPPVEVDPTEVPRIVRRAAALADVRGRRRRHRGVVAACALLGLVGIGAAAAGPVVFPHPSAYHEDGRSTIAAVIRLSWQQPDGRQAVCGYQPWYVGHMSAAAEEELTAYVRDHDWSDLSRRLVAAGSLKGYANMPPQIRAMIDAPRSTPSPGVVVHIPARATPPPPVPAETVTSAFQTAADSIVGTGVVRFGGITLISCATE